ncbi:MAG: lipid-A-disaccharide synthase [Pseudomonadota bacterium]
MDNTHVMILAGEASGDAHAAEFALQLKKLHPEIRLSGMGSHEMQQAGVEVFFDSSIIAVVGLVEVIKHWSDIKQAMAIVKKKINETQPDILVLVDYPEFNLKMAKYAQSLGIKVLFYISPQVWAWRPKRIHKIGRLIDHMAVIFQFELTYYERAGIPASFVGHPLVGKVQTSSSVEATRLQLGLGADDRVIGLFPGSRQSEILRLLPLMLDTARTMQQQEPGLKFLLPVATTLDLESIRQQCDDSGVEILVCRDNIYDLISSCDAIATCSGTVTLEIALLGVPMCILYKMSSISYFIMSRLITIPHIGLANIVAGSAVVRELLQDDANADALSRELFELINDHNYREKVQTGLSRVRDNLGHENGAENVANLILELAQNTNLSKRN